MPQFTEAEIKEGEWYATINLSLRTDLRAFERKRNATDEQVLEALGKYAPEISKERYLAAQELFKAGAHK